MALAIRFVTVVDMGSFSRRVVIAQVESSRRDAVIIAQQFTAGYQDECR
jgi:hypothetical protein